MELVRRFVPESFVEVVKERLDKLTRRARKQGMPEPFMAFGERESRLACPFVHEHDPACARAMWQEVIIIGEPVKFDGWRLVASVDNIEGKPFFRSVPGEDVPLSYRDTDPSYCEHCKTHRFRNETHIVAHDDGRYLQAGSTCIKDFLGWNVDAVAAYFDGLASLIDDDERLGSYVKPYFTPEHVIDVASRVVSVDGRYVKAEYEEDSTKSKVFEFLFPPAGSTEREDYREFVNKYNAQPDRAQLIKTKTLEAIPTLDVNKSDWAYNLSTCMSAEYITTKQVGVVASAVILGLRAIEDAATRQVNEKVERKHIGTIGSKVTVTVTVTDFRYVESQWGGSYLITMQDDDGNLFKWFASSTPAAMQVNYNSNDRMYNPTGRSFNVTGTVKKHDEYKGVKSTVLTRCKVEAK